MIGMLFGVVSLIAAGCLITIVIALTIKWLRNKIKEKLDKKKVKEVAVFDMQRLVDECDNKMSMDELDSVVDKGYTNVMAEIGYDGQIIGDIELIKDTNDALDQEVEKLLGREGMLVVGA